MTAHSLSSAAIDTRQDRRHETDPPTSESGHSTGRNVSHSARAAPGTGVRARGLGGSAVIKPVESNLAEKFWTSVRTSSGAATAALAKDQDPDTAWLATDRRTGQWLTLDLGGAYDNVRKVEVVFPDPAAVYRYVVEASADGRHWGVVVDRSHQAGKSRGAVDLFTRKGTRYLRVRITGTSPGAIVGISEIKAFNYLRDNLVNGADQSYADQYRTRKYYVNPNPEHQNMGAGPGLLDVSKDRGMQFTRLRIWNEPRSEETGELTTPAYQGPDRSAAVAKEIRQHGMELGIDFHYSDSWADPGKQPKPRAWAQLGFDELVTTMHDFTYDYVRRLVKQGTTPDKVAVGNEVINGFLYGSEAAEIGTTQPAYFNDQKDIYQSQPGGGLLWRYWGSTNADEQRRYDEAWDRFATLMAAGISAVRAASPGTSVEIHAIVDKDRLAKTMEFWHQLLTRLQALGVDPDVLALSYYPEWHGTPEDLDTYLHTIAATYPRYKLEVSETAYPASGGDGSPLPNSPFPRTVQGQADAIQRVFQAANDVIDNAALGVLMWEPANFQTMFEEVPGMPNYYQPYASIDVFTKSFARHILQDRVYTTTRLGKRPQLPAKVHLLTTKDRSVRSVPVTWKASDASWLDATGEFTVTGRTAFGTVTAVVNVVDK